MDKPGLIPEEIVREVLETCNMLTVLNAFIPLKADGKLWKGPCPFHQGDEWSLAVHEARQLFHCATCGVSGNMLYFVMRYTRWSFPRVVKWLYEMKYLTES